MYKSLFLLLSLILVQNASAHGGSCTEWVQKEDVVARNSFAGRDAYIYERKCDHNTCSYRNMNAYCHMEKAFYIENPDNIEGVCSRWYKHHGTTCQNKLTGDWEQKWERFCKTGLTTKLCTNRGPNK